MDTDRTSIKTSRFARTLPLTDVSQADINRVIQTVRHLPSAAN